MKNYLLLLLTFTMALFLTLTPAKAENIVFVSGEVFSQPIYDLDVALTLENISGSRYPYCYSGDISDNTEASFNAMSWDEDDEGCYGRWKPTWEDIISRNQSAHSTLHQLGMLKNGYFSFIDRPILKADMVTVKANVATMQTSVTALENRMSDAELLDRANHTGSLFISAVTGLQTALNNKVDKVTGKALSTNDFTDLEKTKLIAIENGATANSTDITLLNRGNHTGNQAMSTVSGLDTALNGKQDKIDAGAHIHIIEATAINTLVTDVNELRGLIDAEMAIAEGNAAQNAMADIVNEMSAKVNLLLAHLQDQGLQNLHE